jgi:hypothetical protein
MGIIPTGFDPIGKTGKVLSMHHVTAILKLNMPEHCA